MRGIGGIEIFFGGSEPGAQGGTFLDGAGEIFFGAVQFGFNLADVLFDPGGVLGGWRGGCLRGSRGCIICGSGGAALIGAAVVLEDAGFRLPHFLDPEHDFWHTSLTFFFIRIGMLFVTLWLSYLWCAKGPGLRGFSPFIQLGQTSLLVYWVHIEFVYGKYSIIPKRASTALVSTIGLGVIFVAMLLLSLARTRWKASRKPAQA